jgi:hypothetical protein
VTEVLLKPTRLLSMQKVLLWRVLNVLRKMVYWLIGGMNILIVDRGTACMLGISVMIRLSMGLEVQPHMLQSAYCYAHRYVCCRLIIHAVCMEAIACWCITFVCGALCRSISMHWQFAQL